MSETSLLTRPERRRLAALAETALPAGLRLPGADTRTVLRVEAELASLPSRVAWAWRLLALPLDLAAVATTGRRFSSLAPRRRLDVLRRMEAFEPTRLALRGLVAPLKLAHFDDPVLHDALGCRYAVEPPARLEPARWRAQVFDAAALPPGESLECDVVVVGTGAGGAPLAARLAARGRAVLLLEEGEYFTRRDFTGRPLEMMRRMYRRAGATIALGNTAIPVPVGRGVGGTTLVNSGTCFRVPEHTLAEWRSASGVAALSPEHLAPYYAEVERFLEVGPSSSRAIGAVGDLIAKGCDALGYRHHPLARNAPGCDGQGLCCFGCPTDAKRSTNVSYVPAALSAGAQLLTRVRVERVLVEHGRAAGVEGVTVGDGAPRAVSVRAKVVVLSCGTLSTPVLLLGQGLANGSGQVGRNLSIHPAIAAIGIFPDEVRGFDAVPQGHGIDEFQHEGLLFEGASLPLQLSALATPGYGPAFTALMEQAQHTLVFGFLVKDTSRGRVRRGRNGEPRISYWLNDTDLAKVRRGLGILARVYFAAGATQVVVPVAGFERLETLDDVARLERAPFRARHVDITAYHPLGTCRMGVRPADSVVSPTHETHEVPGLFIVDGSALPGSPGVNPQLTIMALSLRAADFVDDAIVRLP